MIKWLFFTHYLIESVGGKCTPEPFCVHVSEKNEKVLE